MYVSMYMSPALCRLYISLSIPLISQKSAVHLRYYAVKFEFQIKII